MSKSNKNPPKKPDSDEEEGRPSSSARRDGERKKKESKDKKKCHKRLNEKERILLNNMTETVEKLLEGDCKRKRHRRRRRSPSSEDTGLGGEIRTTGMEEVESSSEFEDPRPGRSRDPPRRQECRRRRRHQRRPAERPNDSSSSPCSPQQQQQQRKPPSTRRCAQNERPDATLILRKSPVKEQCVSNRNEADPGGRPEIQRLRMQLIAKVRKKAPNVQEQVKRAIRMMKLDELEKIDKKTRGQKEFTKAQCNQFQRMYDKWQHSIKPKKFVSRSIKGPVADYWDRRHEERAQAAQAAAQAGAESLFEQALRVAAAWAAAAPLVDPSGGYSPIKESSGEWRTPPRPQVRTRRRGDPGVRRRIEFSSESEDSDDGESRPRARPPRHRRRPRCKDGDDGLLDE